MNPTQPMSAAICELEKAEHGMALPYDAEHLEQLRREEVMPHRRRWAARLFLASVLLAPQVCFADVIDKYMNASPYYVF